MIHLNGTVKHVKILKSSERPLVFFKLDDTNCLIASHSLNFLADAAEGTKIAVAGEYNSRKQFVVRKYAVIGKPQIVIEFEKSLYPKRNK
ncbi:hypothetical protein [Enterococcus sp. DIV0755b]|uniref:hypothetical protein n=1 Tax=Enterococcus sp. DIV0755b TaxID=2774657 RepID=UPI003F687679